MNLDQIETKSFIMALFIRDDNERFLLGTGAYEFKDSQLHFAGNTIENDVVSIQGNDGYMLAGQVRRPNTQVFDGYIGDATTTKSEVEGFRRDFFAFFRKNHFYTVVYIMADGSAIQRRKGFLVDAPTVKELWQMYPEYHVGFNFEDINYYNYTENAQGEETYGKSADVGLAKAMYGGLIWEEDGITTTTGTGTNITLAGTMEGGAIESVELNGDTEQTTYSGKNLLPYPYNVTSGTTSRGITITTNNDGTAVLNGKNDNTGQTVFMLFNDSDNPLSIPAGTYYFPEPASDATFGYMIYTGSQYIAFNSGVNFTRTFASSISARQIYIFVNQGVTTQFNNKKIYPMFTTSAQHTEADYEPYVGGTASPNPDYPQEVKTVTGEQSIEVRGSKNLFNVSLYDGITQNADGTVKSTKYYTNATAVSLHLEPSTRYTISIRNSNGELNGQGWGVAVNGTWINTTSGTGAVTTDANGDVTLTVGASSYGAIGGYNAFFQLEKGSSATTYEPYKGVTKTVNLGKNLLPFTNQNFTKNNITFSVTDGTLYLDGTSTGETLPSNQTWKDNFAFTLQAGTYTFSLNTVTSASYINKMSDNTTLATVNGNSTKKATFTITEPTEVYLGFYMYNLSYSNLATTYQLEKGSTVTTYAPYFTPIELCKIGDYQDYIYKSGDDWYVQKNILGLDMSSIASWEGGNKNFYSLTFDTNYGVIKNQPQISNIFTYSATSWAGEGKFGIATNTGALWLTISDSTVTSSNLSTWLGNKNGVMYAVLSTPTDTQITNSALISELEGLLSATTYSGNTYITVSGDLASPLKVVAEAFDGGGVEWDANGAVWEDGGGGATTVVAVDSIDNVLPVWTITGKSVNPVLTNLTTAMSISYNGTIAQGQTLVVDLLNKTAKLNGTSVIQNISGSWVEFAPGNNKVSYTTDNSDAPDSTIEWQEIVG